jgi:hypothetical protein
VHCIVDQLLVTEGVLLTQYINSLQQHSTACSYHILALPLATTQRPCCTQQARYVPDKPQVHGACAEPVYETFNSTAVLRTSLPSLPGAQSTHLQPGLACLCVVPYPCAEQVKQCQQHKHTTRVTTHNQRQGERSLQQQQQQRHRWFSSSSSSSSSTGSQSSSSGTHWQQYKHTPQPNRPCANVNLHCPSSLPSVVMCIPPVSSPPAQWRTPLLLLTTPSTSSTPSPQRPCPTDASIAIKIQTHIKYFHYVVFIY